MLTRARQQAAGVVRCAIADWAQFMPTREREDLILVVNELVSNAVVHGPDGGSIRIAAVRHPHAVQVRVRDEGQLQFVEPREPDDRGGRGLNLLEAIADSWGSASDPTCVWFTLNWADQPHDAS